MKTFGVVTILFVAACGCPNERVARVDTVFPSFGYEGPARDTKGKAFDRLRSLVGTWEAKRTDGKVVRASYREVANGSALVETFTTSSGKETLTVFHRDGEKLMLTHYCAQGNQPRLQAASITSDGIWFRFLDVSNLGEREDVLTGLRLAFRTANTFEKQETYRGTSGASETTTLVFERAKADGAPMPAPTGDAPRSPALP